MAFSKLTEPCRLQIWVWLLFGTVFFLAKTTHQAYIELDIGQTNMISLSDDGFAKVDFTYMSKQNPQLMATLDTGLELPVYLNTMTKQGSVFVSSKTFTDANVEFGTYLLTIVLHDDGSNYNCTKEMAIFYEEHIEGCQVTAKTIKSYPEHEVELDVMLTKGSNVEIEWMFDNDNDSCLSEYFGPVRYVTKTFQFNASRAHNVTVFFSNNISRTYVTVPITTKSRPLTFVRRLSNAKAKIEKQKSQIPTFKSIEIYPRMERKLK